MTNSVCSLDILPNRISKARRSAHALFETSGLGARAAVWSGLPSSHCRYPPGSVSEMKNVSAGKAIAWHTEYDCTNAVIKHVWDKI
jgi:hypothetical protein